MFEAITGAIRNAFGGGGPPPAVTQGPVTDGGSPESYVKYVNRLYDEWYEWRYSFEPGWYMDVAFYLGMQYSEWNDVNRSLRETKAPSWRVRYVVNQIMPAIETVVGKMTRGMPILTCVPKQSPSDRAYTDARMGDKLLRGLWAPLSMPEVIQEWFYWAFITGDGWLKCCWDPTAGKPIRIPGQPTVYQGEMRIVPMGPYSILTPPYQSSMTREPAKIMEARLYDVDHARALWPNAAGKIEPGEDDRRTDSFEERLSSLVAPGASRSEGKRKAGQSRRVLVKELVEDPQTMSEEDREQFPDGRITITVGDVLAEPPKNNPYGWMPYIHLKGKVVPGRLHGASMVDQLIPIQRNLNQGRSDVIESRRLCSRPMVNVEKNHGITRPLAEPGRWLERQKGWSEPKFMDPPRMSDYHVKDLSDTREDFQSVSQQREVTRGTLPSSNVTGVAINMLQDADNTPLGPLANRVAAGYEALGIRIISMGQKFYREPRMLAVVGDGHEEEVVEFLGPRHPTELTVRCPVESVIPESRAAKQARVMEAVDKRVLDPQLHRAQILRVAQLGNVDDVWEQSDAHRRKARRENREMTQGLPTQVDSFDPDDIHLLEHETYQASPEYASLPPQIKAAFELHTSFHRVRLAAKAAGMVAAAPAQGGAPPARQEGGGSALPV